MSVNGFDFDGTVHRYNYNSLDNIPPNIAPAYSASSTYAVGDYCTKDNVLYKCSTAISTAEAWNSAHWTQVQLATDVADLKDDLSQVEGFNDDIKQALMDCFHHVALWSDGNGSQYCDALYNALYGTEPEQWDFEWNYTDGLPNNNGMTLTNNGGTIALTNDGLSVATQNTSSSNVVYKYESIGNVKAKVISELVFVVTSFTSVSGGGIRCYASLGGDSATAKRPGQFLFAQDGIKYLSGSSWAVLHSAVYQTNTEYTMRIEQTADNADVYINGVKVGTLTQFEENVMYPQFTVHRGASALFKSFKLRIFDE